MLGNARLDRHFLELHNHAASLSTRSGVSLIRHTFQEGAELQGALHGSINVDVGARVAIGAWIVAHAVAFGLGQNVSIGPAALEFVADAAVEVVLVPGVDPEGEKALGELVVDEFGDGAVKPAHPSESRVMSLTGPKT